MTLFTSHFGYFLSTKKNPSNIFFAPNFIYTPKIKSLNSIKGKRNEKIEELYHAYCLSKALRLFLNDALQNLFHNKTKSPRRMDHMIFSTPFLF